MKLNSHQTQIEEDMSFGGTWPFEAHFSDAPGFAMHYIDEGRGSDTLLLLHGEPTWGYLFRNQIPMWTKNARVIAPDHMGFGKSGTPENRTYWLQDHIDNLESFVLSMKLRDITLVMHDFGGPVGMGLAARHPDLIKQFISVNGPTPFGQSDLLERLTNNAGISPWFQWIVQANDQGVLEEVLAHLSFNILSTLKLNGFVNNEIISDTWINAYKAPFLTPQQSLGAIGWAKGFAIGAHAFEEPSTDTLEKIKQKPAMMIWGVRDQTLNAEQFLPLFSELFPNAPIHLLPNVGHYSPEDAPEEVGRLVLDYLGKRTRP
ncbi:MAG: alpha/beta fold hydrolase [Rhizobiaceae bacterium]